MADGHNPPSLGVKALVSPTRRNRTTITPF